MEYIWLVVVALLAKMLSPYVPNLDQAKNRMVKYFYGESYYPGSWLMSGWCWLRHPINRERRAEAEYSAGFSWSDPEGIL